MILFITCYFVCLLYSFFLNFVFLHYEILVIIFEHYMI